MKEEILLYLCRHTCNLYGGWYPVPSTLIADHFKMTRYKALKLLRELRDEGLIIAHKFCEYSDWDCSNHLYNGFILTQKGHETPQYEQAWEEERAACKEIFGYDIGNCTHGKGYTG